MVWRLRSSISQAPVTPEAREHEPGAPALAVVIVAYETPDHLAACLDSLAREGVLGSAPVIVVDNSRRTPCAAVARATPGR